ELETLVGWQKELRRVGGFRPVVVGASVKAYEEQAAMDEEESADQEVRPRTKAGRGEKIVGVAIPASPEPLDAEGQRAVDTIAIVTVQDGPSLTPGEIIAPAVGNDANQPDYHNNYQDPEAFLRAGGRRGRQYVPLTDGTYFINRWFATVEVIPKTVVPIG